MASNLRVDTILPSTGTSLGIGTASGTTTVTGNLVASSASITGNLGVGGTLTYEDVTNIDSVGVITAREGIRIGAGKSIGSDGAAVVYYGDGSNLTGAGPTFTNGADNRVITATSASAITGEANLTYDGTDLTVTGSNTKIIVDSRGSNGDQAHIQLLAKDGSGNNNFGEIEYDGDGDFSISSRGTGSANNDIVFKTTASNVERLRISSAGYVTKPYNPCASMTIDGSTLSGNYMSHNTVHTNIGNHYNTGTSIFTCPVAGLYYVSIMVMSNNNNTTMDLEFHINGSNSNNILVPYQAATGGQYNQVSGSTIVSCPASAQLRFKLNSGDIYSGRHSNMTFALFA